MTLTSASCRVHRRMNCELAQKSRDRPLTCPDRCLSPSEALYVSNHPDAVLRAHHLNNWGGSLPESGHKYT
jgi:hypothetical protein